MRIVVILILLNGLWVGADAVQMPAQNSSQCSAELIAHSVAKLQADWAAAPRYSYTERDVAIKGDAKTVKTYRVSMISGSPYRQLIAVDDQPLPPERRREEQNKLRREIAARSRESTAERSRRIKEYLREREQDESLLREMVRAFQFSPGGEEVVNGFRTQLFVANPRSEYHPASLETSVLTGMRGKLWTDVVTHQWVRVQAEVFRPVSFGLFIARVSPGTRFVLEQAPVTEDIWLPSHFRTEMNTSILGFQRTSIQDETYSDYRADHPPR